MDDKNNGLIGVTDPKFSQPQQQSQFSQQHQPSQQMAPVNQAPMPNSWAPPPSHDGSAPYWGDMNSPSSRSIKPQNQGFFLNSGANPLSHQNPQLQQSLPPHQQHNAGSQPLMQNSQLAAHPNTQLSGAPIVSISGPNQNQATGPSLSGGMDEDLIPTAIVIKNIPFAIKKEQLLEVMTNLHLPIPYAFNYHFDNGVFRGLAFANFATPDETSAVINNLNGREIGGRKLRVEYKKMLPLAERERIEREKREKRGQLEEQHRGPNSKNIRTQHQHHQGHHHQSHNNHQQQQQQQQHHHHPQHQGQQQQQNQQPFQQGGLNQPGQQGPMHIGQQQMGGNGTFGGQQNSMGNFMGNHLHSSHSSSPGVSGANVLTQSPSAQINISNNSKVDLNDPENLELYSKILLFRDDRARNQLSFPASLSTQQRRSIMLLCQQMGVVYNPQEKGGVIISRVPLSGVSPNTTGNSSNNGFNNQHGSQQLPPPGIFDGRHPLQNHNSMSATNLSTFAAQPALGLQHPRPQSPGMPALHLQSPHNNILFSQSGSQFSGAGNGQSASNSSSGSNSSVNHNVLRGTKSFADIRAPVGNFAGSSPGTPSGSPFFPSQTPPPQNQPNQNPSQGQISLSLQQQRGYGFYNQGSQPYLQSGQTQSQMLNPGQQQPQQQSPAQQSQFNGLPHAQSQLHQSSAFGNLGSGSSSSANDFQFGQHPPQGIPSQSHTPQPHQQQYGNSFGAPGSAGIGSLTDSFSSMLNLGGSLSRAPSVSSLNPSMGNSFHTSVGGNNIGTSLTGFSGSPLHNANGNFSSMIGSITGGSVGSASPAASITSIVGHNNPNDSLTKGLGNGNSNANVINEDKGNENKNMASPTKMSNGENSPAVSVGLGSMDDTPSSDMFHVNSSNSDSRLGSSSLTSEAGIIGSKLVASSSMGVSSSDVNTTNANVNVNESNEVTLKND